MRLGGRSSAVLLAAVLSAVPAAEAPPALPTLLERATRYVADFVERFSHVVTEERYNQVLTPPPRGSARLGSTATGANFMQDPPTERTLTSDFLLVKPMGADDWQSFREVFAVDGRAVRDRDQRLAALFLDSSDKTAATRASEIAAEGARYQFGRGRTLNSPLLALAFLQPPYQARFRWTLRKVDAAVGADVWIVDYEERTRPTILRAVRRGKPDQDLAAHGRMWIEGATGRVLRTELRAEDNSIVTSFRVDEMFQIAVPIEMRESFLMPEGQVKGTVTYGRFRRFNVSTEEKVQ